MLSAGRLLARSGAEDAVDEAGRVGAAVLLGQLDRLVDRDLGRDVLAVEHLVERRPA